MYIVYISEAIIITLISSHSKIIISYFILGTSKSYQKFWSNWLH